MKTLKLLLCIAGVIAVTRLLAAESPTQSRLADVPAASTNTDPSAVNGQTLSPVPPADLPDPAVSEGSNTVAQTSTNGLLLNFHNAPLALVLDYLSDAAGFIINKEAEVKGTVDVWSKQPVSKDDAVKLLNSVLRKNGYGVTRDGRILTIVALESAKTSDLDILQGDKWEDVEKGDEVVTQIIPVRYANATQLMNNLQVLLPTTDSISVNESANSIILVATKTDIRRMLRIVRALDTSIASVSSIKVFPLRYADAKELATVVQQLFSPQAGQNAGANNPRAQFFNMMRGGAFGGPGGGPGGNNGNNGANAAGTKVTAAADEYSNSLIVSASTELMATISDMVQQIDQPASDVTELRVFRLVNADPSELADQLSQLFPEDTTRTGNNQNQGGGGFRFFGGRNNNQATSSDRMKKKGRVLAVPDPRTSSLLVSAASDLMPQIAEMIERLDASPAKKEVVKVFDLENADPQDVNQVLQDLFQRSGNIRANNNNTRTSLLGQGNPLTQRATQQQTTTTTSTSGFGNTRGGGNMGGF